MIQDIEMSTRYEELNDQVEFNTSQLRELYAISKADKLNFLLYILVVILLIIFFCFLAVSFLSPRFNNLLRPEIVDFSGVLIILTAFAIVQIFQGFYAVWIRLSEIRMSIIEQENALLNARKILDQRLP